MLSALLSAPLAGGEEPEHYQRTLNHQDYEIAVSVSGKEAKERGSYEIAVYGDGRLIARLSGRRAGVLESSWIDDLDSDSAFDLILVFRALDEGRSGAIKLYEWTDKLYLLPVEIAPLSPPQSQGYLGYDHYHVHEGTLYREFPRFPNNDRNATPSAATARYRYDFATSKWIDAES